MNAASETVVRDTRRADLAAAAAALEPDLWLLRSASTALVTQFARMKSTPITLAALVVPAARVELMTAFDYGLLERLIAHCRLLLECGRDVVAITHDDHLNVRDVLSSAEQMRDLTVPYRAALAELTAPRKAGAK